MSHSYTPLDNISQQDVDAAHETATNVFQCASTNQSHVYIIHGPHSEHEGKERFPHINTYEPHQKDYYLPMNEVVQLHPHDSNISFVWSGVDNNTIIIHSKVNHVVIRRSKQIHLDIKEGTISGVDILHCCKSTIKMPRHNYTNLEFGESINFNAIIDNVSQLHITGSLDVKVNDDSVLISPFTNAILTENGWIYKKQSGLSKLMLCKY